MKKLKSYCVHCKKFNSLQVLLSKQLLRNKDFCFYRIRCFTCKQINTFFAHDKDVKYV